ncbi:MAG: LptF/LptG family permease [Candidatus Lambdaproteobacteria bacterium]|nr:LptF/LptG family permease [Candidatus Lambdaproteobacteria bacterium]
MILSRAIFFELFPPFFVTFFVMTFMLVMEKIYRLINMMVTKRLSLAEVTQMLIYLLPQSLVVTLPLAAVGAVFIVVIRQSLDSELISMRASGKSLWRYVLPFALFGLLITLAHLALTLWLQPLGYRKFAELQVNIIKSRAEEKLVPGEFNFDFGDKVIRIGAKKENNEITDVFLADRRLGINSSVVLARRGRIVIEESARKVVFLLKDGTMYFPGDTVTFRQLDFADLSYVIDFEPGDTSSVNLYWGLTLAELRYKIRYAEQPRLYRLRQILELHTRFSTPWACLAFSVAAVPLAIVDPRAGRAGSFLRAIFLVVAYYILWIGFKDLIYGGRAPAELLWLAPALILAYGLFRLWRINYEMRPPLRLFRGKLAG